MSNRWIAVPIAALLVLAVVVVRSSLRNSRWEFVSSLRELQDEVVIHDEDDGAFVIAKDGRVLAFSDDSPHLGETYTYCLESGQWEGPHGEKWDWRGRYYGGPAPRGLNRMAVKVEDDEVFIDPEVVTLGPSRGAPALGPDGPFCSEEG